LRILTWGFHTHSSHIGGNETFTCLLSLTPKANRGSKFLGAFPRHLSPTSAVHIFPMNAHTSIRPLAAALILRTLSPNEKFRPPRTMGTLITTRGHFLNQGGGQTKSPMSQNTAGVAHSMSHQWGERPSLSCRARGRLPGRQENIRSCGTRRR